MALSKWTAWRRRHATAYRAGQRRRAQARRTRYRAEILAAYGNRCARCGFNDPRALCLDHVNGDGAQERRQKGSPYQGEIMKFYRNVIKLQFPIKYQLLCANCNMIKARENGEFRVSAV